MWRGSLLPFGCAAVVERPTRGSWMTTPATFGAAAPPSGSKLPRHKSLDVYLDNLGVGTGARALRHCLQLRQNPPTCAP
ncbi:hypothetical protein FHK92_10000 [Pseudomonas brassicacearum subsp. neoaurantiaca]|uniref:Uncharacterized protein n=1 Tax=Pseudomonas brassicacearum subsp. neoaurantiaca TaxID=494916 RepID=A0A7V8UC13_9PSED|nr:hypothetical protein [Pseudomonas brassicacearum subsp. neoaurantiaca]